MSRAFEPTFFDQFSTAMISKQSGLAMNFGTGRRRKLLQDDLQSLIET